MSPPEIREAPGPPWPGAAESRTEAASPGQGLAAFSREASVAPGKQERGRLGPESPDKLEQVKPGQVKPGQVKPERARVARDKLALVGPRQRAVSPEGPA